MVPEINLAKGLLQMKTAIELKRLFLMLAALLAGSLLAGGLPTSRAVQARTDENLINPVTLSAGGTHTCAVKGDGALACWVNDENGQTNPPTGTFSQVSAGGYHTSAVKRRSTVPRANLPALERIKRFLLRCNCKEGGLAGILMQSRLA